MTVSQILAKHYTRYGYRYTVISHDGYTVFASNNWLKALTGCENHRGRASVYDSERKCIVAWNY